VLLRRTLAAMAVTIGVFLAVRLPAETWLRPRLQGPLLVTGPAATPAAGCPDELIVRFKPVGQ
jgi:hypothetical protein